MVKNKSDYIFEELANELDITPTLFEAAEKRYQAVGKWLNREDSYLNQLGIEAEIFLQGSAKLGTVTKPIEDNDEYDIDAVCELKNVSKKNFTQKQVKDIFGKDIKTYATANNMNEKPKNGKRCWTLNYNENAKFHMDFLPGVIDANDFGILLKSKQYTKVDYKETTLAITDKTSLVYNAISDDWEVSNPKGYFEWFKEKMKDRYISQRQTLAKKMNMDIEKVPEYKIKTSLQKSIQILKRHRDIFFKNKEDLKVSSIIITTLAAHSYTGNPSLSVSLLEILDKMPNFITCNGNEYMILNPINPMENFADKWKENNDLVKEFYGWIRNAKADILAIIKEEDNIFENKSIRENYQNKFGRKAFNNAYGKCLKEYESKFNKKAGVILGTATISHISKPYGGDCHN